MSVAITGSEPSGRLGNEEAADAKKASRDSLDREGDNPLLVALGDVQVDTVVDDCGRQSGCDRLRYALRQLTESGDRSDLPAELVEPNKTATDSSGRDFGHIDRGEVARHTDAQTDNHATGVHDAQAGLVRCDALHGSTGHEDD